MLNIQLVAAGFALSVAPAFAGGLTASITQCSDSVSTTSLPGSIATALAKTLLSGAIDSVSQALNEERAETYDVVIPVDDLTALLGKNNQCLQVSSIVSAKKEEREAGSERFRAKFKFIQHATSKATWRPVVIEWIYKDFLSEACPWYLRCTRRDVAFSLEMFAPGTKPPVGDGASQPLGVVIENADAGAVQTALNRNDTLPWFLASPVNGPVNLRFRMVETMEPHAFSKALAAALKAEKENILTTVESKLKGISDQVAAEAAQKDVSAATSALNAYSTAWQAASTTKEAYAKATDRERPQLALTYALQFKAVALNELLARAAFDIAGIAWPVGGLGALPPSL